LEAKQYMKQLTFDKNVSCCQRWLQYIKCFLVYMV
jgi:hypothetical protein